MSKLYDFRELLKPGKVYRRGDLASFSNTLDRHLSSILKEGTLQKLSRGIYYYPKESVFGKTPPEEKDVVRAFLNDDRFLLTSFNAYNSLGVGTTQLYNERIVYNHKRHGEFILGNRKFKFQIKRNFPEKLSIEFLLIDLINNIDRLAEDKDAILKKALIKANQLDKKKLKQAIIHYGDSKTKRLFNSQQLGNADFINVAS